MQADTELQPLSARLDRVEARAMAADRLIKALITLISLENPEMLDNLEIVFEMASRQNSDTPAKAWDLIRKELTAIRAVVETETKLH